MNEVGFFNKTNEKIEELDTVQKFIEYAIEYLKLESVTFNIIIINNEEIHKINKEYRGIDRPTDVISFALEDDDTFIDMGKRIWRRGHFW